MIKRKSNPPLTEIEVGSFSDVAFLLIIFFILTTQIASFKGTVADIPSGEPPKAEQPKKEENKQLTIHLSGLDIRVGTGESSAPVPVSFEELKARLLAENYYAKSKKEERFVILQADNAVPYGNYFKAVMMIQDAGGILCLMESDSAEPEGT